MYLRLALNLLRILTILELQENPWPEHPECHHSPYIINLELCSAAVCLSLSHAHTDTHHTHMHTYTHIQIHIHRHTYLTYLTHAHTTHVHTHMYHTYMYVHTHVHTHTCRHSEKYLYIMYLSRNFYSKYMKSTQLCNEGNRRSMAGRPAPEPPQPVPDSCRDSILGTGEPKGLGVEGVKSGELRVQGHPQLYNRFKASLGYIKPFLK